MKKIQFFGFTLVELIIVVVVMGILATIAMPLFMGSRERAFDREAQANLRLILAAERTYRMEDSSNLYIQTGSVDTINTFLKLMLPSNADRNWDYLTRTAGGNTSFCAQADRMPGGPARTWRIVSPTVGDTDPQPVLGNCP